jgi:hypothetical protein
VKKRRKESYLVETDSDTGTRAEVLLPTAGAVHAAATSSTLDADWLQRAGAVAAKRRAKPKQQE